VPCGVRPLGPVETGLPNPAGENPFVALLASVLELVLPDEARLGEAVLAVVEFDPELPAEFAETEQLYCRWILVTLVVL